MSVRHITSSHCVTSLCIQHTNKHTQYSVLSTQYLLLSTQYSCQCVASPLHTVSPASADTDRHSERHASPFTQYSVLATQYLVLVQSSVLSVS